MTKKELIEAIDNLDDDAVVFADVSIDICGQDHHVEMCDVAVSNAYTDCIVLKIEV